MSAMTYRRFDILAWTARRRTPPSISGTKSVAQTMPRRPTRSAMPSAGSPVPLARSATVWPALMPAASMRRAL